MDFAGDPLSFCRFKPSKGDVKEPTMFGAGLRSNLQNEKKTKERFQ